MAFENGSQIKTGDEMVAVTWILILFAHVGPLGDGNSNALTSVSGFKSTQACLQAGRDAKNLVSGTVKKIEFVCVPDQVVQN